MESAKRHSHTCTPIYTDTHTKQKQKQTKHIHPHTRTTHTHTDDECLLFPPSGRRAPRHCIRAIPGQERQGDQADDPADPRGPPPCHIG